MTRSAEVHLTPGAEAAGQARAFVASQLSAWQVDHCRDEAALVTSELVTNVVRHGRGPITVKMIEDDSCVRLEVRDISTEVPVACVPAGPSGGFGMHLVDAVCSKWGVSRLHDGKVVWCECGR